MAKSHRTTSGRLDSSVTRSADWVRHAVSSFALLASLISLGIIVHNQYGARLAAALIKGIAAIDLAQLDAQIDEQAPVAVDPHEAKYRAIGEYLARRYRVSSDMTASIVAKAHSAGAELKVDPLLILAVIAVESRFNPIAESAMGAKGLMQIIPRFHREKFAPLGGVQVALDPAVNIIVGAQILKEYIRRAGDVGEGLQRYVGAPADDGEHGYSNKVMTERERLQTMLRQYQKQNRVGAPSPRGGRSQPSATAI